MEGTLETILSLAAGIELVKRETTHVVGSSDKKYFAILHFGTIGTERLNNFSSGCELHFPEGKVQLQISREVYERLLPKVKIGPTYGYLEVKL